MKLCPNCHRISKDDDFCSHCGSAVYGDNNYSGNDLIDCDNYKGHSHEKQTFSEQKYSSGPIVNGPEYQGRDFTRMSDGPVKKIKQKKKGGGCIKTIVVLAVIAYIFGEMGLEFSDIADFFDALYFEFFC